MTVILKIMGTSTQLWPEARYVKSFDHSKPPEESVVLTEFKDFAHRFPDTTAALECWRGINQVVPVRPDGQPNRPLSAYTVELVKLEETRH